MLLPASVEECYEMSMDAFDLAERLQTIIYVMSDLDLGMNTWMSQPFKYPEKPLDRGKVLDEAKVRELGASWGRYKDVDGDGIPGARCRARARRRIFTRGSGHNEMAQYTERPDDYVKNLDRLRASSTRRARWCRAVSSATTRREGRHHRVRIEPLGRRGVARSASRRGRSHDVVSALRAYPFTPSVDEFIRRTTASTSSSRTATRRC
jgi:2-oxoglutarate ferredoxin oxidoreductase subunit alpha